MKKTTISFFTLLEIVICMAILGIVAGFTGWGINNMMTDYRFNKSVKILLSDLKKNHLICLADQVDMELWVSKKEKGFTYCFRCDEPSFRPQSKTLKGVKGIRCKKPIGDTFTLPLYSSGRIGNAPIELTFLKNETEGFILDLKQPHEFLLRHIPAPG